MPLRTGWLSALAGANKEGRKARGEGHFRPFPDSFLEAEGTGVQISAKNQRSETAFFPTKLDTLLMPRVPKSL
jgi:hypothetical protein